MDALNIPTIITIAFLGSFGHCSSMCGGIVVAYSSLKIKSSWGKKQQATAHLIYSFGRVATYVMLGFIFGYLGEIIAFSEYSKGIFLLFAGSSMIFAGVLLATKIKISLNRSIANMAWYKNIVQKTILSSSMRSFFILGALNGLLPCGFTSVFLITSASSANPLLGALVMLIFGLSTIPALFSIGFFVSIFKQTSLKKIIITIASIITIFYGLYICYLGFNIAIN